ncbi:FtsX-like permease family protein [Kitasatospora sp. NPDC096147]|uniref:FtsX-like permease family protein n=1 Tax=Kitasatospora sp. NPDC096147 TaxID=3364093 RepID=UPI00381D7695
MSAWRPLLRMARRDALRSKGRSALVAAMIALPVVGATGVDVVHRSTQLTAAERSDRLMGRADALVGAYEPGHAIEQAVFPKDGVRSLPQRADAPLTPEQKRAVATEPADLLRELLPQGSVVTPARIGPVAVVGSSEGMASVETFEADLATGLWKGRIDLVSGRAPAAAREAAATPAFLKATGKQVGDTVTVRGLESAPFTLTGTVEHPEDLGKTELVARPGELYAPLDEALAKAGVAPKTEAAEAAAGRKAAWLVTVPAGAKLGWEKVTELNAHGYTMASRQVAADPPAAAMARQEAVDAQGERERRVMTIAVTAAMALLEVALLAGPAFAVGARRARRQLALLGAAGGRPGHVRTVVLGGGLVLGTLGAAAGGVLGVLLVSALRPWIEEWGGSRFGALTIRPFDLLLILLVGVATALAAALQPALQAGRREVLAGLTDRDPVRRSGRWVPLAGLLLGLAGAGLAVGGAVLAPVGGMPVLAGLSVRSLTVLGGGVLAELGLLLVTPLLLAGLGRLARRFPVGPRLALRDASRHRSRTAPAVAAVLAAVAGAVAVGVHTSGAEAQDRAGYRMQQPANSVRVNLYGDQDAMPQLRTALPQDLPELGERADLFQAEYRFCDTCSSVVQPKGAERYGRGGFEKVVVGDAAVLRNLLALRDPAAEAALAAGKAVVTDPAYLHGGKAELRMQGSSMEERTVSVDAVLVELPVGQRFVPMVVGERTIRQLGLSVVPAGAIWLPAGPVAERAEQRATATVARIAPHSEFVVERGFRAKDSVMQIAISGFAALVVLGAALVSTALAAADARRERAVLSAVGARPRTRRTVAGLQAGLIVLLGALLGTVSGFVPAYALLRSRIAGVMGAPAVLPASAVPWVTIAVLTLALPLLAGLFGALRRDENG